MSNYTFRPPISNEIKRNRLSSLTSLRSVIHGDLFTLDGIAIQRDSQLEGAKRLPLALNNAQTFHGDLIPSSSWGSSLANLLTKRSWDMLRHPVIQKYNNICMVCGTRHDSMDVHEIWSYGFPSDEEIREANRGDEMCFGIQRLDAMIPVCKECHECFHLGFASINHRLDVALKRIRIINQWSEKELHLYKEMVFDRFSEASEIFWMLDFSKLKHPEGGLSIKSPWIRHDEDKRFLMSPNKYDDGVQVTMIAGIPWKFAKDTQWNPVEKIN